MKIRLTESPILTILVLLLSASTSLFVFLTLPAGKFYGDLLGYIALGKEISANSMLIPSVNTIHYPGSAWVYPPVIPYLAAIFVMVSNGYSLQMLSAFSVLTVSLTSIPALKLMRNIFGPEEGSVGGILYALYFPSLYEETWGGLPQLLAILLLITMLAIVTSRNDRVNKWDSSAVLLLGFAIPFVHDLTSILILPSLLIAILLFIVLKSGRSRESILSAISLIGLVTGISIWYLPRLWWVIDSAFPTSNGVFSSLSSIVPSSSSTGILHSLYSVQQVSSAAAIIPYGWILVVAFFMLSVVVLFKFVDHRQFPVMAAFLLLPLVLTFAYIDDNVLSARFSYFAYLFSFLLVAPMFYRMLKATLNSFEGRRSKGITSKYTVRIVSACLIAVMVSLSVSGMLYDAGSHAYYAYSDNRSEFQYSMDTVHFLGQHHSSGTVVAAGTIGFLIMAYDALPVIEYQPLNYLTQPVEWNESYAAYEILHHPDSNISRQMIIRYNVSYVIMSPGEIDLPEYYNPVYSNPYFAIYVV